MFDICGLWLMKHLMGDIQLPDKISMTQDGKDWAKRNQEVTNLHQVVDFQTEYVMDLVKDCGEDFPYDINMSDILHENVSVGMRIFLHSEITVTHPNTQGQRQQNQVFNL